MWTLNYYYNKFTEGFLSIFVLLAIRWRLFDIFYSSGIQGVNDIERKISLFTDEYKLPVIPPDIAAYTATFFEVTCGVLVLIGFMTRWAALPMLIMTIVIQGFVYQLDIHYFWMMLAGTLMCFGPGKVSVDYGICLWMQWRNNKTYK